MKYTIECSFGEIIDKITILEIKQKKSTNAEQTENITKELHHLRKYCLHENDIFLKLYADLSKTNQRLWILEDVIREKSRKKEFDKTYIQTAEHIHITNDVRFTMKQKLNELVGSDFKEYKFYTDEHLVDRIANGPAVSLNIAPTPTEHETNMLEYAKYLYTNQKFAESFMVLDKLMQQFSQYEITPFIAEIYFSHKTVARIVGKYNPDIQKMDYIGSRVDDLFTDLVKKIHYKMSYGFFLLEHQRYLETQEYIKYMQPVTVNNMVHNINPDNMSYFRTGDTDKTLLVYSSGGIGDIIMHTRFLRRICKEQEPYNNRVVFIINDNLAWVYDELFKDITNLCIVLDSHKTVFLPRYDYHTNMMMLMVHLKLDYKDIYVDYFLENLPKHNTEILDGLITPDKLNICFNWHGNYANSHEKFNRGSTLKDWIPLFKMKGVRWISLQKEVTEEELKIMKRYNVLDMHDKLDQTPNFAFKDTIDILRAVDFMITTDTSLLHIAGTANITKCWALLTVAADWRWTDDAVTNWYPNIKMFRQKKALDWSSVMDDLSKEIRNYVT